MKCPSFIAYVSLDFLFGCFTITIIITKHLNYKTSKYFIKLLIDVLKIIFKRLQFCPSKHIA